MTGTYFNTMLTFGSSNPWENQFNNYKSNPISFGMSGLSMPLPFFGINDSDNIDYSSYLTGDFSSSLLIFNMYLNNQMPLSWQTNLFDKSYNTKTNLTSLNGIYNPDLGNKLANITEKNASGTIGQCLGGVRTAMEKAGLSKGGAGSLGGAAYEAANKLAQRPDKFTEVTKLISNKDDLLNLPAGCIIVFDKNRSQNKANARLSDTYGHIMVTRGDKWAVSDHPENLGETINNYSGQYRVFVPITPKKDTPKTIDRTA